MTVNDRLTTLEDRTRKLEAHTGLTLPNIFPSSRLKISGARVEMENYMEIPSGIIGIFSYTDKAKDDD